VIPLQAILERGNEGVCSTSREIAIAAGLADSGSSADGLTGRNTCISWLKPKRNLLSWLRKLGLEGLQGLLIGKPGESQTIEVYLYLAMRTHLAALQNFGSNRCPLEGGILTMIERCF
jgi:hypothetical protein